MNAPHNLNDRRWVTYTGIAIIHCNQGDFDMTREARERCLPAIAELRAAGPRQPQRARRAARRFQARASVN